MALQNLRSNTANKRPTASGMVDGQVAINTNATNPGLFFKDAGDGIRKVGPVFIGSSAPNSSPAAGGSTGHSIGEQWLDTSNSRYVVKTWDGTVWRDDDSNYLQLTGGSLSGALTIDNAASVSALDLKFDGDTDTGFYAPAANTLGFVGGGTERVRIDSSGSVGIGTTSPTNPLTVVGTSGTGANAALRLEDESAQGITIGIENDGDVVVDYLTKDLYIAANGSEKLRIDSSGNVGIGTSSPSYPLDVNGNAQFGTGSAWRTDTNLFKSTATGGANIRSASGSASTPIYSAVGDEDTGVYFPEANAVAVSTAGSQCLLIDGSGRVGINTTANQADLDVNGTSGAGTIRIGSSSTSRSVITHVNNASNSYLLINVDEGNNSAANTHFKISVDGSEQLRIDHNGNVGIGTNAPSEKLHVAGSARIGANDTSSAYIELGQGATGNRNAYIDLVGDTTYSDFGLRIIRNNGGANTTSVIDHRGTGTLEIKTREAAPIVFTTSATEKLRVTSDGKVGIGTASPGANLDIAASANPTIRLSDTAGSRGEFIYNESGSVSTLTIAADPADASTPDTDMRFTVDGSEAMRIDSDGKITARGPLEIYDNTSESYVWIQNGTGSGQNNGATLYFGNNKGASISYIEALNYFVNIEVNDTEIMRLQDYNENGDLRMALCGSAIGSNAVVNINNPTNSNATYGLFVEDKGAIFEGDVGIGTSNPSTTLHVAGTARVGANDTSNAVLEVGAGATGNRNAILDFVGDTTYTDYGLRIIRTSTGANAASLFEHRGTGAFGIKTREAAALTFSTTNTERFRVTNLGKMLIGFTSPRSNFFNGTDSPKLQLESTTFVDSAISCVRNVNNTAAGGLILGKSRGTTNNSNTVVQNNDALGQISFQGADGSEMVEAAKITANIDAAPGANDMPGRLVFMTTANGASSASERMRIRENGRIGIGTTTPESTLEISRSNADDRTDLRVKNFRPGIRFVDISSNAADGEIVVDGGSMRFRVSQETNASTALTERMRINSSGQLGVGTTSPTKKLHVNGEAFITGNTFFHSTNSSAILAGTAIGKYFQTDGNLISGKTTTNGNTHQAFCNPNGIVGTIRTSGSATQYNTSSDYRLKENVVDIADGITRVKQLQPRRFNFIADADTIVDGFIAHEAQTVVPEAVSGTHNEVDEDGKAVMQGIDQSKLVPLLTAALKEAIAKIETLETRVAALEAE